MEPAREQNERRGSDEPLYKVFIGTGITYGPFVGPKYQETFDIDGDTTRMTVEHEKCITAEKGKAPRFVRSSSTLSG
ncbi:hypothetical protein AX774_g3608 [Zancudomyces culisetae]|uniref:Uncharacterized protein n=2 Tax=Zancudomyces culisetae TaxID=1213189 RepID=A0A1R1PPU5_ZANCU|nr:hypothetical protein AX774_g3608 [Zancudomyces culisetae]|eukprot:OMH82902.1 hypothetical protein AX774_g3608 [Zancudomyces culisetae]